MLRVTLVLRLAWCTVFKTSREKYAKRKRKVGCSWGASHLGGLDAFLPAFLGVPVDIVRLKLLVVTRAGLGRVQL